MLCDTTGRHLMMPHIDVYFFQWNWAQPKDRNDEVSPWHEADDKNTSLILYRKRSEKSAFFVVN
jgi:hypothetical protein